MNNQHKARKRFGQNFLVNRGIIDSIILSIDPNSEDTILEIGPGLGALTDSLVASNAKIIAVEIDRDLAAGLQNKYQNSSNIQILNQDILDFDFSSLGKIKVIGNLPYNISSHLLFLLYEQLQNIECMTFMLQKEVAERLCASINTKQYGRMSVMSQLYCDIHTVIDVPPECFDPPPKVNSAVVKMLPKPEVKVDKKCLKELLTTAFNQRRKTISNSLKPLLNAEELSNIGIDAKLRAENLTLQDYLNICNYLTAQRN